ncbi:MAG: hypothetical protein MZV64_34265 [Ignavibacteriales bacterium]|nr:hypothetical protein [Ignavibacteriales bacterium]
MAAGTADKALLREYAEFLAEAGELGLSLEVLEKLAADAPKDAAISKRVEEIKAKLGVYEIPSQYDAIPALESVAREDLAALIAVKFERRSRGAGPADRDPGRYLRLLGRAFHRHRRLPADHPDLGQPHLPAPADHQPGRAGRRGRAPHRGPPAERARFVPLVEERRIQIADVTADSVFHSSIVKALAYQIMTLTPERRFEPERTVSGEEAIRVLDIIKDLAK